MNKLYLFEIFCFLFKIVFIITVGVYGIKSIYERIQKELCFF